MEMNGSGEDQDDPDGMAVPPEPDKGIHFLFPTVSVNQFLSAPLQCQTFIQDLDMIYWFLMTIICNSVHKKHTRTVKGLICGDETFASGMFLRPMQNFWHIIRLIILINSLVLYSTFMLDLM